MIPRKQALLPRINPPKPILINLLRLPNLRILRENQLIFLRHKAVPQSQTSQSHASIRRQDVLWCAVVFQRQAADNIANDDALLGAVWRVLEADDGHAVGLKTAAPAVGAVGLGDFPCSDEAVVAFVADVIVAFVAGIAVEAGVGRRDGVVADVAVLADGEGDVAIFGQVGHGDDEVWRLLVVLGGDGAGVRYGEERVGAVVAAVEAGGAVAPGAFEADVAVPVCRV